MGENDRGECHSKSLLDFGVLVIMNGDSSLRPALRREAVYEAVPHSVVCALGLSSSFPLN